MYIDKEINKRTASKDANKIVSDLERIAKFLVNKYNKIDNTPGFDNRDKVLRLIAESIFSVVAAAYFLDSRIEKHSKVSRSKVIPDLLRIIAKRIST